MELSGARPSSAHDILRVLRRRGWIVLLATVVVAGAAIALSLREAAQYQASADVLLKYQSLASGLSGIQDLSGVYQDPMRIAETQTQVASSPAVGQLVVAAARKQGIDAPGFLGYATVTASEDSDVLTFTVTYTDAAAAATLATIHAREYIRYRQQLDTQALVAARRELQGRITEIRASPLGKSTLLDKLVETEQQLRTMEALQTANASLLRPAEGAAQVQPRPRRNAVLGIVLGLMLGVGLAFAREVLDLRVRSSQQIGQTLGLPLLARLPAPKKRLAKARKLVMLANPHGRQAEAFRMFRANLAFVNMDRGARSIVVTSALEGEGKSTTVSNLAVTLARGGSRVVLVDLDQRRPALARFFGIARGQPGVANVVLGSCALDQALFEVLGGQATAPAGFGRGLNGHENGGSDVPSGGVLCVLPAGDITLDPGEFVSSPRLVTLVRELEQRFDFVLIDTPPMLSVGDAMALTSYVDAVVVVTRLNVLKRPSLEEFGRALNACPAVKLGYVVTGADGESVYGYTGYDYYGRGFDFDIRTPTEERV